ncbi:AraC family transcriptional regulator [Cohnella thailandensis]|uniref:Helix-turn-helix transcriptional regulator n=1 Tax=Cohnella thailandensis TaxID=557557 RepID=A0A841SVL9_9BACL|nr:AraC family transcriptional regulator [Cohnella thailandensis]MBB6634656.1 helix-turn-helix transcriptional regulator [Cohnella thailandensis]
MQEYDYEFAQFIYYTPGNLDKEAQLWPVRAGRSIAKPNYKVGPKRIECYSLHFVYDGRVRVEWDGNWAELQKGDLFCLFPGRTYHYRMLPSESPLRMSWLALDGARVKSLLSLAEVSPSAPYRRQAFASATQETAESAIEALAGAERWKPAEAMALQSMICRLFAELIPDGASVDAEEPSGWIRECIGFMELHATEGISVQQVAEFAGVHRSYFSGVFAGQVGMPPLKYIQKIRMEKAQRLLSETDATVTEIAFSLGYPNLYTFTRAFKSYFDLSPLAVRAKRGREATDE